MDGDLGGVTIHIDLRNALGVFLIDIVNFLLTLAYIWNRRIRQLEVSGKPQAATTEPTRDEKEGACSGTASIEYM